MKHLLRVQHLPLGTCSEHCSKVEQSLFGDGQDQLCPDDLRFCFTDERPDYDFALRRVGGFVLDNKPLPPALIDKLPDAIVSLSKRTPPRYGSAVGNYFAIHYISIPGLIEGDFDRFTSWCLALPKRARLLIHGNMPDNEIDTIDFASRRPSFWQMLKLIPSATFLSLDCSVYSSGCQCCRAGWFNLSRSIQFCVNARQHGLPMIPSVGWRTGKDLDRIGDWISLSGDTVSHIAMNSQTGGKCMEIHYQNAEAIRYISARAMFPIRWVVTGPSVLSTLRPYFKLNPATSFSFVSGRVWQRSMCRRGIARETKLLTSRKQDYLAKNYRDWLTAIHQLRKEYGGDSQGVLFEL